MSQPESPRIRFDWTINVGTLLQMVLLAILLISSYTRLSDRMTNLETKVSIMFAWWEGAVVDGKPGRR